MRAIMLLAVSTCVAFKAPLVKGQHAPVVRRLRTNAPVPDGWRRASYNDALRNKASFALVLYDWHIAELADGFKIGGRGYRGSIEQQGQEEGLGHKLVVRFPPGAILQRERRERRIEEVGRSAGWVAVCSFLALVATDVTMHLTKRGLTSTGIHLLGAARRLVNGVFVAGFVVAWPIWLRGIWISWRGQLAE